MTKKYFNTPSFKLTMKKLPKNEGHIIGITIFCLLIIGCKVLVGRLPHVLCTLSLILLLANRINSMSSQLSKISEGVIEYPSLIKIMDSFQLVEVICIVWGLYLMITYTIDHFRNFSLVDCVLISLLFSQILFLIMTMIQQIFISFLFTTAVGHGFFLFSVLPRFVAGARTLLVSFIWFDTIKSFEFFSPILLIITYIVFKGIFLLLWSYDLFSILFSKDFPPEFKTAFCKDGFSCPVCMENVQFYITLPCTHQFCLQCFCKWGSIHLNCPLCRTKFSSWLHQVDLSQILWFSLIIF